MEYSGGLQLDQYNKSTPPGWRPGLYHYPYRRFIERLRLWYRITDLNAEQVGPAVAGRLQGRPFNLAMSLTITDRGGEVLTGDSALAFAGRDPTIDQPTGRITEPALENGLQTLIRVLHHKYGMDDQVNVRDLIDSFLDLRRGRLSLLEYLNEHEYTLDEATKQAGLGLNNVGRTHFLLKHSGLSSDRMIARIRA